MPVLSCDPMYMLIIHDAAKSKLKVANIASNIKDYINFDQQPEPSFFLSFCHPRLVLQRTGKGNGDRKAVDSKRANKQPIYLK